MCVPLELAMERVRYLWIIRRIKATAEMTNRRARKRSTQSGKRKTTTTSAAARTMLTDSTTLMNENSLVRGGAPSG